MMASVLSPCRCASPAPATPQPATEPHDHLAPPPPLRHPARVTLALVGNPNAGKTSLFNALTGQDQHVGNWPGKTVTYQEGLWRAARDVLLVDLPGTYSLTAFTPEEALARDVLARAPLDGVLNVVDASHLDRHLYLTAEVLELGLPTLVVLNMMDVAAREGVTVDTDALAQALGVPVVPTIAARGQGLDDLAVYLRQDPAAWGRNPRPVRYPPEVDDAAQQLVALLHQHGYHDPRARWVALKLLEGQDALAAALFTDAAREAVRKAARDARNALRQALGDDPALIIADARYGWAHGLVQRVVRRAGRAGFSWSRALDRWAMHRWLGLPLFLLIMGFMFHLVVNVSEPLLTWLEMVLNGPVQRAVLAGLHAVHAPLWLRSLVVDGVLAGVGSMLTFVPGLTLLYLALAWLEDSGYMARVAFLMDRVMRAFGLHGKAFLPLLLGLGCNVPAVYATRTLERRRDRLLVALVIPFMSCSARLPVYLVFTLTFFPTRAALIIWGLYVLGMVVALASARLLSHLLPPEEAGYFVLELPPYHWPTPAVLWRQVYRQVREFVVRAGTVIVAISVVLWALTHLPWGAPLERSLLARVSARLAPALEPLGFGKWEAASALLSGFIAKEVVVATMGTIYVGGELDAQALMAPEPFAWGEAVRQTVVGLGQALGEAARRLVGLGQGVGWLQVGDADPGLSTALRQAFTPPAALAFLVFTLLYVPCAATVAAIRQEFGARWALVSVVYQLSVAWSFAWIAYRLAQFVG